MTSVGGTDYVIWNESNLKYEKDLFYLDLNEHVSLEVTKASTELETDPEFNFFN
jgi:hypothetical protein